MVRSAAAPRVSNHEAPAGGMIRPKCVYPESAAGICRVLSDVARHSFCSNPVA